MIDRRHLVILAALFFTTVHATDIAGFATAGISHIAGNDSDYGFKLGADFSKNRWQFGSLGMTAFVTRFSGSENYSANRCQLKATINGIAVGSTYTFGPLDSNWIFQGRIYPLLAQREIVDKCPYTRRTSHDFTAYGGVGVSGQYLFDDSVGLRIDVDILNRNTQLLTVGMQYRF
ncbi:MAG: hypothetical protein QM808_00885 [Steroidobacteraceae bacterium]